MTGTRSRLERPVDGSSLAAFRVLFGLAMFVALVRFMAKGWIDELLVAPRHHFKFHGFAWIEPWPAWGLYLHFAALAGLALAIAAGYRRRLAAFLFLAGFTYVELLDAAYYLNHYYLVSLLAFLLVLLPSGRTVPAWAVWTLRFQIGLVYFYAGAAKLQPDWLVEAQPLSTWIAASATWLDRPGVPHLASWAGAIFDLSVPFLLAWRRTRPLAYAGVIGFHVFTAALFPLGMFPWIMILATTVFFEPDWPRRLGLRLATSSPAGPTPRWILAAAGLHLLVQLAVPLRHHLYPGDRLWTEEGFRFAWHVMLVEKSGHVDFHVTDPATGRRWLVGPEDYLTGLQTKMMQTQPDLILQTAHWIAEDFRSRGIPDVEVRADAHVSLNGRPGRRLVDPEVDLARERDGFAPKAWILH